MKRTMPRKSSEQPLHGSAEVTLDVPGAAALLAVSEHTIRKWILIRALPFYKLNTSVRFDRDELLRWRDARRVAPMVETKAAAR